MALTQPATILEFAPTANPLDAAPVWVDITTRLQTATTRRGRQHELGVMQAGTMELRLDNRDGFLNPWNSASPWYYGGAGLRPFKPIRLRATWAGTTYPVWRGFVEAFNPRWDSPVDSEMELRCVDGFKVFQLAHMTSTRYRDAVLADGAHAYYRMDDVSGDVCRDVAGGYHGRYLGSPTLGIAGALLTDPNTAFGTPGRSAMVLLPSGAAISGSGAFALEAWLRLDSVPIATGSFYRQLAGDGTAWLAAYVEASTRKLLLAYVDSSGHSLAAFESTIGVPVDGAFHHVVLARAGDGFTYTWYLDGVAVGSAADGAVARNFAAGMTPVVVGDNVSGQYLLDGAIDELAIYVGTTLSPAQVDNHYWLATAGYAVANQLSGARIASVLDLVGWPSTLRTVDAGVSLVQPATQSQIAETALSYMQKVEMTEVGALFMSADGKVVFQQRDKVLKPPYTVSQLTVGPANEPYVLAGTAPAGDDNDIYNEVVCQRDGGQPQIVSDAASIASFGRRTLAETGLLATGDGEVVDRANYRLSGAKDFATRIEKVRVRPADDAAVLFPQVLTRDLRDRITFVRSFLGQGDALSQQLLIEGIEHQVTQDDWHTTWSAAPASTLAYWVLGTAALGTDTRAAM